MPNLSEANKRDLNALMKAYNALPWYKAIIFPRKTKAALKAYQDCANTKKSAWFICNTFLNNTNAFQRQIFSSLRAFAHSHLIEAYKITDDFSLLDGHAAQANFDAVASHCSPLHIAFALYNNMDLLTGDEAQANRSAMAGHQSPKTVAKALHILHLAGLLTGIAAKENRDAITTHQDLTTLSDVLLTLHTAHILDQDAFDKVITRPFIQSKASVIRRIDVQNYSTTQPSLSAQKKSFYQASTS